MKLMTLLVTLVCLAPLAAQEPRPTPPTPVAVEPAAHIVPAQPVAIPLGSRVGEMPSGYDDGRRRDPFMSLVSNRRSSAVSTLDPNRPRTGLASLALADVTVRGIVKSDKVMLVILEAPNKQSFVARVHDHLMDASVQSIDAQGVVFAEPTQPGMPPSQVRKVLRPVGEEIR